MSALGNLVYRFRGPDERPLSGLAKPVSQTPKAFDTLVLLVQGAGHGGWPAEAMQPTPTAHSHPRWFDSALATIQIMCWSRMTRT